MIRRKARAALALLAALLLLPAAPRAGVKYGDAVPAIITARDLERIKRELGLTRFSVIAAVRLGAAEGREAVVTEPLDDATLEEIAGACEAGGFCPDAFGFLASRVRIILLANQGIEVRLTADGRVRNPRGRLFDFEAKGIEGRFLAWSGRADESSGHVAIDIVPVTRLETEGIAPEDAVGTGGQPPFSLRWNEATGRFQLYDCTRDERGRRQCGFEPET